MSHTPLRFFDCQFAPCAETRRDVIRVAQPVYANGVSAYEAFTPAAFRDAGVKAANVAVLLDHDVSKRAGTVSVLSAHKDWHLATFVLDGPYASEAAAHIKRGGKVSPGFDPLDKDPDFARPITSNHRPFHWFTRAKLNEISVCSPGSIVWYEGARVTHAYEPKPATSNHTATPPAASSPKPSPPARKAAVPIVGAAPRRPTPREEEEELRRRIDFNPDARFEDVLENLKAELGYSSDWWKR